MANLAIVVDGGTLKKARMRALEEGTSVDAVLSERLEEYAGVRRERQEAWREIEELAGDIGVDRGGRTFPSARSRTSARSRRILPRARRAVFDADLL